MKLESSRNQPLAADLPMEPFFTPFFNGSIAISWQIFERKSAQLGACQGYAYPQDPTEPPLAAAAISPTSALELVGAAAKMGDGS